MNNSLAHAVGLNRNTGFWLLWFAFLFFIAIFLSLLFAALA
jgi:ABC-type multidrug transport system permease subunit